MGEGFVHKKPRICRYLQKLILFCGCTQIVDMLQSRCLQPNAFSFSSSSSSPTFFCQQQHRAKSSNASPYSPITAKAASTTTTAAATTTSNNPYFIHHHLIRPSLTNVFDSAIGFESPFFLSNMNQFSTQNSNWNRLATSPTSPKLLSPWTTEISESKLKGKVK